MLNTTGPLGSSSALRLQQRDRLVEHPAIDRWHHLVTLRGGQEAVGPDRLALGPIMRSSSS